MVRVAGLEPARPLSRKILSLVCLPIPPHPLKDLDVSVLCNLLLLCLATE